MWFASVPSTSPASFQSRKTQMTSLIFNIHTIAAWHARACHTTVPATYWYYSLSYRYLVLLFDTGTCVSQGDSDAIENHFVKLLVRERKESKLPRWTVYLVRHGTSYRGYALSFVGRCGGCCWSSMHHSMAASKEV